MASEFDFDLDTQHQQPYHQVQQQDMANNTQQQDIELNHGTKRDAGSLFVDQDQETDGHEDRSTKRLKLHQTKVDKIFSDLSINEDGKVARYDAFTIEERPRLAIYHPSFKETEKMISTVCEDFLRVESELKAAGYHNDEIQHICDLLSNKYLILSGRYPLVAPVACLGPSGVGKSSTINSILHQVGAAYESDSPSRGTNLVHEFSMPFKFGTAMFQVAAPYLWQNQIETMVAQHWANIMAYHGELKDIDEAEMDDIQRKYDTAIEFFRILLCNRKEFATDAKVRESLESLLMNDVDDTIEYLTKLIEDFKRTRKLQDNVEYHDAESYKELAEIFRRISRVSLLSAGQPHPWPILTKVGIRHDNMLLNAGITIGDTPGVDDINQSVVDATREYVKKAGIVLVFTKFERGAINEMLDSNLTECIALGKTHGIHLVVTNIDGRKVTDAEREELRDTDRAQLEEAEDLVRKLREEKKFLKQGSATARKNKDLEEWQELEDRLSEIPIKTAIAEANVEQAMVEIKCRMMASQVKNKLRKLDKSRTAPDLPIHFVSNSQYQKHLAGYEATKPPSLDVEGTGIPAIRRMLYQIPARGKSTTLSRIGKTLLPSIFGSIIGVLTKSRLERKKEVLKVITDVLDKYTNAVEDLMTEIRQKFNERVVQVFDENKQHWVDRANKLVDEWEKHKTQTLAAFCRRSGNWRPSKCDKKISWNALIQSITVNDVADGFNAFDDDLIALVNHATNDISELFRGLETKLEECEDFQGVPGTKDFFKSIQHIRDTVLKSLEGVFRLLRAEMDDVRHTCILDNNSYVGQAMQPTYDMCKLVTNTNPEPTLTGTGRPRYQKSTVHPRRVELIREKLKGSSEQQSVFESVCHRMCTAFEKQLVAWEQEKCVPKLKKGCDQVIVEFERRFAVEEEIKQEGDQEAIEKLKDAAYSALSIIEGPMRENIKRFEEYEKGGDV